MQIFARGNGRIFSKIKAKDLLAQALSHEIDHLNGITFVEKMIPGTLEYVEPEKQ